MHLPRIGHDVIPRPEIDGQPRRHLDIVLYKEAFTVRDKPDQAWRKLIAQNLVWRAGEETRVSIAARRAGGEGPQAARAQVQERIKTAPVNQISAAAYPILILESEAHHVSPLHPC